MGADSAIQWTHHTFNPWRGCTKVSPGCEHCYAETLSKRNPSTLGTWGPGGTRVVAAESYWRQPLRWNRDAAAAGERRRVFCASLADVFEDYSGDFPRVNGAHGGVRCMVDASGARLCTRTGREIRRQWPEGESGWRPYCMSDVRERLWQLIEETPHLDWLLLTKRPDRALVCTYARWEDRPWPANVWLGTTVEDQARADERIPALLRVPAALRFLSVEPLLGPVDLSPYLRLSERSRWCWPCGYSTNRIGEPCPNCGSELTPDRRVGWVIVGGESGPGARPMHPAWARSLREECRGAGVPFFFKQHGAWTPRRPANYCALTRRRWSHESVALFADGTRYRADQPDTWGTRGMETLYRTASHNGELADLDQDLRVREFPTVGGAS